MKKSILLSIILSLSLVACIPQAMAQKQSRMEKLLRYLNDNDTEKWQKNREKVDNDTKAYYAEELALLDVLNGLWNEQSEQAATDYFGCYGKAANAYFSNICEEEKIPLPNVGQSGTGYYPHIGGFERTDTFQPYTAGQHSFKRLYGRLRYCTEDTEYP